METIAKILSLTFLAVFGGMAAAVYLVDSDFFPSFLGEPISNSNDYEKAESHVDLSSYRKHLLESYTEQQLPQDTQSRSEKRKLLWNDTYDGELGSLEYSPSEEAKRLAEENSLNALQEKMYYWQNQYYQTLNQPIQAYEASDAYGKYRIYKEALEIKSGL